jgi:hypothetical protein
MRLGFFPDNLAWEGKDTLWVAGSEMWPGFKYMYLLRDRAPSHVVRIRLPEPGAEAERFEGVPLTPVYDDDGGEITACSIAAPFKVNGEGRFIVGACFGDHAILCRAPRAA